MKPKSTPKSKKKLETKVKQPASLTSRRESLFRKGIIENVRPWGKFRSYPTAEAGAIKIVTVNPGGALSLQVHKKRSEFWVILDPGLEMTLGDKTWLTKPGEEIFIPCRTPHRLRCVSGMPARVMEIWIGRHSSEDDIIRLQDLYGRILKSSAKLSGKKSSGMTG